MQVIIGGRDITKYINESTYKMDSVAESNKWEDGNFQTHKIISRYRIKGSFVVALYGQDGMNINTLNQLFEAATTDNVTIIGVYVTNKGKYEAIRAYCEMKTKAHRELSDGSYLDLIQVSVEEK